MNVYALTTEAINDNAFVYANSEQEAKEKFIELCVNRHPCWCYFEEDICYFNRDNVTFDLAYDDKGKLFVDIEHPNGTETIERKDIVDKFNNDDDKIYDYIFSCMTNNLVILGASEDEACKYIKFLKRETESYDEDIDIDKEIPDSVLRIMAKLYVERNSEITEIEIL